MVMVHIIGKLENKNVENFQKLGIILLKKSSLKKHNRKKIKKYNKVNVQSFLQIQICFISIGTMKTMEQFLLEKYIQKKSMTSVLL